MFSPILTAFNFLTILPLPWRQDAPLSTLGRAVGWFPLVGLGIGAALAGLDWGLSQIFPPGVTAVMVMIVWLLASGAIHFDGFLDSCDGLFGGKTPERRLEIMRDHRVGAFAVAGGGLLLLLRYSALTALPLRTIPLLLAPMLGRRAMALAIVFFPYAREQGLGRAMKDHARWPQALQATLIALAAAWFIGGLSGLAAMLVAGVVMLLTALFIRTRIPGLTGDSYGAINELVEVAALVFFVSLF
jgi:adenosylcobinamide-GDP ribazoletransferase